MALGAQEVSAPLGSQRGGGPDSLPPQLVLTRLLRLVGITSWFELVLAAALCLTCFHYAVLLARGEVEGEFQACRQAMAGPPADRCPVTGSRFLVTPALVRCPDHQQEILRRKD